MWEAFGTPFSLTYLHPINPKRQTSCLGLFEMLTIVMMAGVLVMWWSMFTAL
jgi:hypothetical protein